jgi:hypothetical protein
LNPNLVGVRVLVDNLTLIAIEIWSSLRFLASLTLLMSIKLVAAIFPVAVQVLIVVLYSILDLLLVAANYCRRLNPIDVPFQLLDK